MKFCRHCGTVLQQAAPGLPPQQMGYGQPAYGAPPMQPPMQQPMAPPPQMPPPMQIAPTMAAPMGPPGAGVMGGSIGASTAPGVGAPKAGPAALPANCPRCGSPTQPGFVFCQQCGHKLTPPVDALGGTIAQSGPIGSPVPRPPSQPVPGPGYAPSAQQMGIAPTPAAGAWGSAVSVNRDGTDGERYPLNSEFVVIGRLASSGADIVFDQDRFLARQHARLEPTQDGQARVTPLDTLNGVYRKIDAPVPLSDGTIVLAGREVLRFETLDADEKNGTPLIRHGVALFGSPPREPWGRLLQLLPSGGIRDVRHLWDDEIVIGREDGDLVFADDQFLSRRHASIAWDGSRAVLTDLGSSNGTFVRLTGPMSVKHGDHLRMGDQLFRIELRR